MKSDNWFDPLPSTLMDTLSNEILIHIFAQGTAKEISLWRRVSNHWNTLINDDFVWRTAFRNFWDNKLPLTRIDSDSWKNEYVLRMDEINKMSCHKPSAVRICTKKSEIQDILVIFNADNTLVKILDLKGLTSAQVLSSGILNQKFVLFFDNFFGVAPISSAQFIDKSSLFLGLANGDFIIYDKIPGKSLLEDYHRCESNLHYHAPIVKIFPQNEKSLLVVHLRNENCYEFAKWTLKNGQYSCTDDQRQIISNVKSYLPLYNTNGDITKIVFVNSHGKFFLTPSSIFYSFDNDNEVIIKQVGRTDRLILANLNKILIIKHDSNEIITSFTLPSVKVIRSVHVITEPSETTTESSDVFDGLELIITEDGKISKLSINILQNQMNVEVIDIDDGDNCSGFTSTIYVTPIYFIVINSSAVYVYDTLSLRRINKCVYPKYFLKFHPEAAATIEPLGGNKFLFIWGRNLAQIWDFDPKKPSRKRLNLKSPHFIDKGTVGGKAIRKYSKYNLNSGLAEWTEEQREEDQLDAFRCRINIEGLNEEEMIAYAKLLSSEGTFEGTVDPSVHSVDSSDDPDLLMALQQSLMEM